MLYLVGSLAGGIGLSWMALHPGRRLIASTEKDGVVAASGEGARLNDVSTVSDDGAVLRAWEIRPTAPNGNAVLLLHGVGDNRLGVSGYGAWLVRNHYSVVMPDARAHGYSGGTLATYGIKESADIRHWLDWLAANEHPNCIFGFGESMGAAQLLQSLAKESRFCAVVAECPFATFREVAYARFGRPFHTGDWLGRSFFRPTVDFGFLYTRFRYGLDMESAAPEEAVLRTTVPIFLLHGLADKNIPSYHSLEIQARNPSVITLWRVAGADHCGTHSVAPVEFEQKVLAWLREHSSTNRNSSSVSMNN